AAGFRAVEAKGAVDVAPAVPVVDLEIAEVRAELERVPAVDLGEVIGNVPGIVGLALDTARPDGEIIETELRHGFELRVRKDPQSGVFNEAEIGELHAEAPHGAVGGRGQPRKAQASFVDSGGAEDLGIAQHALLPPGGRDGRKAWDA